MPEVELRIGAFPAHVRTARQIAVSLGRRAGLGDEVLDEVRLAVSEACGLIVALQHHRDRRARHERPEAPPAPLTIRFRDDTGLAVEVACEAPLAPAEGAEAATILALALDADPEPDALPAQATMAVLSALAGEMAVRTGADGARIQLTWAHSRAS